MTNTTPEIDLNHALQSMLEAVKSANFLVKSKTSLDVQSKSGNMQDVVTQVDKTVELHLQKELREK